MTRKERANNVIRELRKAIPEPQTELEYQDPYELIVAVVLSAQCTDERVNKVTPDLFRAFPSVEDLARVEPENVYPLIKSISYPNNKSKHLVGLARMVLNDFDGEIPSTIPELVKLPGVGRKTAQVVASVAFDEDALPVDTHIFRVSNRIGLAVDANTPLKVERQLKKYIATDDWSEGHHLLILHGRYTCLARSPRCEKCTITAYCDYYKSLQKLPAPMSGLKPKKGKFYCATRKHYFDEPTHKMDRSGVKQVSCPKCGSMNVFDSKKGTTTRVVRDFRV
ncbi:MAG: endonuclease III [Rhodothermales bacterium]|nr:endonuclease III [Rhodothermales bacterium]